MSSRKPKPFASLSAAIDALAPSEMLSDLEFLAEDASAADCVRLRDAIDALKCAETVETMVDFTANLRQAAEALTEADGTAQVSAKIARLLVRCEVSIGA